MKEFGAIIVNMSMVQNKFPQLFFACALAVMSLPATASAMEAAAWVPWFGPEGGTESAIENIDKLDVVYLFTYEVDASGNLVNRANYEKTDWKELIETAKDNDVKVIPTIAWFDGDQIHEVLSNRTSRRKHVDAIAKMVENGGFDGVNIDYEQKKSITKDSFSTFLKELDAKLGRKSLTCALEARTPPESLYKDVPKKIDYSNDYTQINKYCDWVEIMAYDQQRADIKLNDERRGVPYMPVADKDWVEKVIKLAVKDIDKNKILLGVPTYGRAWDVTVAPDWYRDYTKVASLNQPRILELSKKYKSPIGRTAGGEAVISYFPDDSVYKKIGKDKTPKKTPKGFEAAAKALAHANKTGDEVQVRFVTWSDSQAIKDKIGLAKRYGLKGIAIFKADSEEDEKIWSLI
jgi:spore germination protein YaaH